MFNGQRNPRAWYLLVICGVWSLSPLFAQDTPPATPAFVPPATLADLEAKVKKWEPQPVLDAIDWLRNRQVKYRKAQVSVEEALKLKNDTPENNAKILSALERLPESDEQVDFEATLNRHAIADIKSTNLLLAQSVYEAEFMTLVGMGLFTYDWNMNPFGDKSALVSWHSSSDRMYDKAVLRDDLVWSDGTPITAHDVVFSYQAIMNPKIDIPAVRQGTDQLQTVVAYDDRTIVFFHKEPLATNVWNINFPILPKHIYEKTIPEDFTLVRSVAHQKLEENPVVGGPYELTNRIRGQEIVLTRRENYYTHNGKQVRPKPYFKTIRINIISDRNTALLALKKGDIDEINIMAEDWKTKTNDAEFYAKNTKVYDVEWTYFHFLWNLKTPYFSDLKVRQALAYAFDYEEMQKTLNYGLYGTSTGPYNQGSWMYPKNAPVPYKQDLDKAEDLLDQAGWEDSDGDGIRDKMINGKLVKFEFTILCPNIPDRLKYCTLLKENLQQIGITCNIRSLEFTVILDLLLKRDFQATYGGWGTGTDPDTSENVYKTDEMRNYGGYSNKRVDELFALGKREFDKTKRAAIYSEIHTNIWNDQPGTFLYTRNAFYAFSKDLRGYTFSPRGPYSYGPGIFALWKPKK